MDSLKTTPHGPPPFGGFNANPKIQQEDWPPGVGSSLGQNSIENLGMVWDTKALDAGRREE